MYYFSIAVKKKNIVIKVNYRRGLFELIVPKRSEVVMGGMHGSQGVEAVLGGMHGSKQQAWWLEQDGENWKSTRL